MIGAKHTPPPWHLGEMDDTAASTEIVANGRDGGTVLVADAWGRDGTQEPGMSADEAIANARLIAAAPKLLAALRRLYDDVHARGYQLDRSTIDAMIAADDAIREATGQ